MWFKFHAADFNKQNEIFCSMGNRIGLRTDKGRRSGSGVRTAESVTHLSWVESGQDSSWVPRSGWDKTSSDLVLGKVQPLRDLQRTRSSPRRFGYSKEPAGILQWNEPTTNDPSTNQLCNMNLWTHHFNLQVSFYIYSFTSYLVARKTYANIL